MVHRLALLLGSIAAVAALTVGLAAAGFAPGTAPAASAPAAADATVADPAQAGTADVQTAADEIAPAPEPTTQVDVVYVQPAATPKTVKVVKHAPAPTAAATPAPTAPPTIVIHKVVRTSGGEGDGGGNEGQDD